MCVYIYIYIYIYTGYTQKNGVGKFHINYGCFSIVSFNSAGSDVLQLPTPFISAQRLSELPLPCITMCHHISTGLHRNLSAQRLSERTVHKHSYKVPVSLSDFFRQVFEKPSNIKFHENPSNGCRVVPSGRTDMTKLLVTFRNFAKTSLKFSETNKILWL